MKILAILFICFIIISVLILILLFLPLKIRLKFLREKNNDFLSIRISFFHGLLKYKLDIPKINLLLFQSALKLEAETVGDNLAGNDVHKKYSLGYLYKKFFNWYPEIKDYMEAGKYLLKKVVPRDIKWRTEFGFSDAALTGISAGILWAVKSSLLSVLYRIFAPTTRLPEIKIIPRFNEKTLQINLDCIFDVKIGYIMITALIILKIYFQHLLYKNVCYLRGVFGGRTTAPN
ncbi:hypothetical protein Dtox_2091 [Desulfofarcimen acetoxidans DSM 771]|uniref:DUF2953 domain-containing protein n=1 Tax=Desulfofarcimen acetoxidans (strain ATCC 49208 / DSM 771 / KCTC 5769 / VKM B-1644 / 5575) TaxID=485916 RepID=C8VZ10_DESAS|nr:DUF2953 domain-containing protein [Desulfofarcimen acetoxidans]ACV62920.1 hypothetical protein Dtox_2091 [Desulfofarcimen acetoxidans DSM 771]